MGIGPQIIQVLLAVLLMVSILAVGKLFFVLGEVSTTLQKLEQTRTEIGTTLVRIEAVADATEKVIREEVVPTVKAAREAIENVEVTTRAIAETTVAARKLAATLENVQKYFTIGGPIAQAVLKKVSSGAGGFFSGIASGFKSVVGTSGAGKSSGQVTAKPTKKDGGKVVRPADATTNEVLKPE